MKGLIMLGELLQSTEISVPLFQIILLLLLSTIFLLFNKIKVALIINYVFVLYWGYIFNRNVLIRSFQNKMDCFVYLYLYFGLGFLILILALVGFFAPE